MEEEDLKLLASLQKLELNNLLSSKESKATKNKKESPTLNPFGGRIFRRRSKSLSSINLGSSCSCIKKNTTVKHTTSFKKSSKKILQEPVLKFLKFPIQKCDKTHYTVKEKTKDKQFGQCSKHRDKDFRSLLDAYEGLNLGHTQSKQRYSALSFQIVRAPLNSSHKPTDSLSSQSTSSQAAPPSSCSTQARMNASSAPCDITIDELASYFETSVHIPKKMSTMAEMMYI